MLVLAHIISKPLWQYFKLIIAWRVSTDILQLFYYYLCCLQNLWQSGRLFFNSKVWVADFDSLQNNHPFTVLKNLNYLYNIPLYDWHLLIYHCNMRHIALQIIATSFTNENEKFITKLHLFGALWNKKKTVYWIQGWAIYALEFISYCYILKIKGIRSPHTWIGKKKIWCI